jgi:hypothetical protein
MLTSVVLAAVSIRPSFYGRTFHSAVDASGAALVDWRTLEQLSRPVRLPSAVRLAGYMLPFDERPDREGRVSRFLLVPDAGNWLHPPHLDAGSVVIVRMDRGAKTPLLDRRPVWVTGDIAPSLIRTAWLEGAYQLTASAVCEWREEQ